METESGSLKLIMAPWGADQYGEDVWILENALAFGLESLFERTGVAYADLYDQLGGEAKRSTIVQPFRDEELLKLAAKAPAGTDAIVDGLFTIVREPSSPGLVSVEAAPRILRLADRTFELPDAFRLASFRPQSVDVDLDDLEGWKALVHLVGHAILRQFDRGAPEPGPELMAGTSSWPAFCNFLKAKRGARTVDEKLGHYRQAARLDPTFYWARFNAGQLHKQQEDYHSARREFLAAVDGAGAEPGRLAELYFELGLCSIFLGDTKTARSFWDRALAAAPNNPTILVNIAGTYEQEEDWSAAESLHEAALQIDPEHYKALASLGRLRAQAGRIEDAIPLYERALALRPNDPVRHAILGGCYLSLGDEAKARTYFEQASSLDPPDSRSPGRADEADDQPAAGDYARQELAKLDAQQSQRRSADDKQSGGWRWFGRS